MPGGTLREYLDERRADGRPLSAGELLKLARQLGRGLAHVHAHGLIHRDVAPANVWLDERHEAHLGDFDSAVQRDAQHEPGLSGATTRIGNLQQRIDEWNPNVAYEPAPMWPCGRAIMQGREPRKGGEAGVTGSSRPNEAQ